MKTRTETKTGLTFYRVNNDMYGNPRYVIHFIEINGSMTYEQTVKKSNKIGGRKFHNKQFGGGIVFQSYNIEQTAEEIKEFFNL